MNKRLVAMAIGTGLLVAWLGGRVVILERQLAAAEAAPVPVRRPVGERPKFITPPIPVPEPLEAPDLHVELAQARAESAALKQQLDDLQKTRPGLRNGPQPRISQYPPDGGGVFTPAVAPQAIDHWTGGEKRRWGHEQAAGEPDTHQPGDIPSAWASKAPDGGEEWLQLDYDRPVDLQQINVLESHNPGAIRKVVAVLPNGREATVWEGTMDPSAADELVSSAFPVEGNVRAQSVKVYLDTARVPGWNEIDAVEVVGRDGTKQWASASRASSSYADP